MVLRTECVSSPDQGLTVIGLLVPTSLDGGKADVLHLTSKMVCSSRQPLSRQPKTALAQTVKARFWRWRSGKMIENL
jgi:hypothetical protein